MSHSGSAIHNITPSPHHCDTGHNRKKKRNRVAQSHDDLGTGAEWQTISIGENPNAVTFAFVACALPLRPFAEDSNLQTTRPLKNRKDNIVGVVPHYRGF